jgi:uncharacterized protein
LHVTLHLTQACNFRCRYCYAAPHAGGVMSPETARAAVDLAVRLARAQAAEQSLGVVFFGGEPLLHPELVRETIRHCREIASRTGQLFHFKLTTNGSLLDEAFLADPLTADVFVALSHDGVPAAHDCHRVDAEGRGTFERLQPKVALLLAHRPYAPAMVVTTPETVTSYAASIRYLFGCGFRYLICSLNFAGAWTPAALRELARQYDELAAWYEEQTVREEKFYFSPFDVKIASHIFPGSCRRERCELGRRQISVAPTGRLFPCVQFVGDGGDSPWCIGDVAHGLDEARREALYRANAAEKESCRDCAIRERCNHFCGCLNRQATGRLEEVSPVLCAHEQMTVRVTDRLAARLFRRKSPMFLQKQYNELFPLVSLAEDHAARGA